MVRFKQKIYTRWDETDRLKQMKDSDILAEKKRSNSPLTMNTLKNTVVGAGTGAVVGGVMGGLKKGRTMSGGAKKGAILAGITAGVVSSIANKKQKEENNFYNSRLEFAQRQAKRRESADWKNNMNNREGYTY